MLEWAWYVHMKPRFLQAQSIFFALLSITLIWSEMTMWVSSVHLSVFYWLYQSTRNSVLLIQWIVIFMPVAYMAYACYWSLYQFRLGNYYRMVTLQLSDSNSILFNAYYVCRLTSPLVYNFLLLMSAQKSAFYKVMGIMQIADFFGNSWNLYFPMVLIFLCFMNVFNGYTKVARMLPFKSCQRFVFDEDFNDERIDEGQKIIADEKDLKLNGHPLSIEFEDSVEERKRRQSNRANNTSNRKPSSILAMFKSKQKGHTQQDDKVQLMEMGEIKGQPVKQSNIAPTPTTTSTTSASRPSVTPVPSAAPSASTSRPSVASTSSTGARPKITRLES